MPEAAKKDRQTSGTAAIGVGIAVGAALLIVVGWFALEAFRSNQAWAAFVRGGPTAAAVWIEDVRAGRLDAAYRATTAAYRARVDRAAFDRWVADHPELKLAPEPRGFSMSSRTTGLTIGFNGVRILDSSKRLTYRTAFRPEGQAPSVLSIVVSGDRDGLRIDQAEIEPEAAPPAGP